MAAAARRLDRRAGRGDGEVTTAVRRGPAVAGVVVLTAALLLTGCKEAPEESLSSGYEPAHVEEVEGSDLLTVTFTQIGADRVGLTTATAGQQGEFTVVPYEALIYDGQGTTWVYTAPEELTYVRAQVTVDHIDGDQVLVADGVSPGTEVVTVGASEVYGSELGIDGGH
jgi:hypothetical protein